MSKQYVAIIPARGGSKGIPKKNIKKFLGKPLVQHSIDYAKESNLINQIILTTDDSEIMEVGKKNNITIINRPKKISGDKATTESAIEHVISLSNFSKKNNIYTIATNQSIKTQKISR